MNVWTGVRKMWLGKDLPKDFVVEKDEFKDGEPGSHSC